MHYGRKEIPCLVKLDWPTEVVAEISNRSLCWAEYHFKNRLLPRKEPLGSSLKVVSTNNYRHLKIRASILICNGNRDKYSVHLQIKCPMFHCLFWIRFVVRSWKRNPFLTFIILIIHNVVELVRLPNMTNTPRRIVNNSVSADCQCHSIINLSMNHCGKPTS